MIKKQIPLFSKSETKNIIYTIDDNFLRFWFRFIYKYVRYIEAGALDRLYDVILRDYPTFSGYSLENYFRAQYRESHLYTGLGGYWDRKGENEIDLIALDDFDKKAIVAEIKRNKENIKLDKLVQKAASIQKELRGYEVEYRALSMEDL